MEVIDQQMQFISTSAHSIDTKINEMLSSDFGKIDIAVAFVFKPGLDLLKEGIEAAIDRGANIRILTTDWHSTTEPQALQKLLEYSQDKSRTGSLDVKIFSHPNKGFHPKAYLFHSGNQESVGLVGSSNLSRSGLLNGQNVEWNYQINNPESAIEEFATLWDEEYTMYLTQEFIDEYADRYRQHLGAGTLKDPPIPTPHDGPTPWPIQKEALAALESTRMEQNHSGLVVMATGLGKTWVAAFDTTRPSYSKVLFIAHRKEILEQTQKVFEQINPDRSVAFYDSSQPKGVFDVTLGMVQTLANHYSNLDPYIFDYIVIDEFHHAQAKSYRKLIHHFRPNFLLGLTATPFRMDNKEILELVNNNLVFEATLADGINRRELCPFTFRSIKDVADYANIPWRNGEFDPKELANAIETQERAEQVFEEWEQLEGPNRKTMAFCQSKTHADFMASFFKDEKEIAAVAVHSDSPEGTREQALVDLANGKIKIIFSVDMFNEGIDLPELDIVLMLRPTYSTVIFLQQLGRGLRKVETNPDKKLDVLDLVGNHRSFLSRFQILASFFGAKEPSFAEAISIITKNDSDLLPKGCEIVADVEVIDLMKEMLPAKEKAALEFQAEILEWFGVHGKRPLLIDIYNKHKREIKLNELNGGDWFSYLDHLNLLNEEEKRALESIQNFLEYLQKGRYNKSHKLSVIRYLSRVNKIFDRASIKEMATSLAWSITKDPVLIYDLYDVSAELHSELVNQNNTVWQNYLRGNALKALNKSEFFTVGEKDLTSVFLNEDLPEVASDMVDEIIDYCMVLQRNRIMKERFKNIEQNGITFKPFDENGNELDARVTIETFQGKPIRVIFHSRSGNRNIQYKDAIETILVRLAGSPYSQILDVVAETRNTFHKPISERRLETDSYPFPLDLSDFKDTDFSKFRKAIAKRNRELTNADSNRFYITIENFNQLDLSDAEHLLAS